MHGEQKFAHHRPLTAGDAVVGTLHVDLVREAGGHAMVTTRTELTTEAGEAALHRHVDDRHAEERVVSTQGSTQSIDSRQHRQHRQQA